MTVIVKLFLTFVFGLLLQYHLYWLVKKDVKKYDDESYTVKTFYEELFNDKAALISIIVWQLAACSFFYIFLALCLVL